MRWEDELWQSSGPELKSAPRRNWDWYDDKVRLGYWFHAQWARVHTPHSPPLLHPHIVIKKDVMSFDSILWDLYQFKRCTLQGWRHSVYSCPCPGRQSSNSWTSLSLFQFTYFQPGLAALRVVSSWTNLGPGLMKSSLKRSSETSGSWERSRWLIMPGVIDTQEGTSCEQNTGAD